ncbi:hypothetical protein CUJ83_08120 [Methanocella sp. CWC-04]|uniref:Uncharacterized protein n=1 Tax=Methanooceanicella nereidis TaxID=2052831 RepID=A0AAP2REY3_9EURY|nr:hypothetical protein [Methanocella sp. CWC-04]MCD1294962.1 hypothetical protein [Methanocella sp. CWC-04]
MKSKDIVIVGILLGIGAIVRYFSLIAPGPITSNLVIAFYSLAIVLVSVTIMEAVGIGIVAGIICALISHSLFPPANLISEPIGALVAVLTVLGITKIAGQKERKDSTVGMVLTGLGLILMLVFAAVVSLDPTNAFGLTFLTTSINKIIFGAVSVLVTLAGLYLIPKKLQEYKAAITALTATLASGLSFIIVAAIVIFQMPGFLYTTKVPPLDVFVLSALPIVIGCAIINMILAHILYIPAKKAMR